PRRNSSASPPGQSADRPNSLILSTGFEERAACSYPAPTLTPLTRISALWNLTCRMMTHAKRPQADVFRSPIAGLSREEAERPKEDDQRNLRPTHSHHAQAERKALVSVWQQASDSSHVRPLQI